MFNVHVFFVGASGVGKSTLAEWAATQYGWPLIQSANSRSYSDRGVTPDEARRNPPLMSEIQQEIQLRTAARLGEAANKGSFVSDRGFDTLIYAPLLANFVDERAEQEIVSIMKDRRAVTHHPGGGVTVDPADGHNAVVFYIRPHQDVLNAARRDDAGRRAMFLSEETVWRMDGAINFFLFDRKMLHVVIDTPVMIDRKAIVREAIAKAIQRN